MNDATQPVTLKPEGEMLRGFWYPALRSIVAAGSATLFMVSSTVGAEVLSPVASIHPSTPISVYQQSEKQGHGVDLVQAELMLDFLESVRRRDKSTAKLDALLAAEGTKLIVAQFNLARKLSMDQYEQLLRGLAEGRYPEIKPADSSERAKRGVAGLRRAWANLQWGVENLPILRERIKFIRGLDLYDASYTLAQQHLPAPEEMQPRLFIVMGGRVGAAALDGDRIYYDLLTMDAVAAHRNRPAPTESDIIDFFAHEMHHVGYRKVLARIRNSLHMTQKQDYVFRFLSGFLSEGSATYLLDGHRDLAQLHERGGFPEVLDNPEKYLNLCEDVLSAIKEGRVTTDEEFDIATAPFLGNTYHATGSYLLSVIDRSLGTEGVMAVVADPRRLLLDYNRAAALSDKKERPPYVFDGRLAETISTIGQ
jgi:hypothetical protein